VYLTGASLGDAVTIKYDTDGKQLWVARYHPSDDGSGRTNAIALDPVGNVYVTGSSLGDYATIKYDTDGNQLWVAATMAQVTVTIEPMPLPWTPREVFT
jgi:hypothetical protein